MLDHRRTRPRRLLLANTVALLAVVLTGSAGWASPWAAQAAGAPRTAPRVEGFATVRAQVLVGGEIADPVRLVPARAGIVTVQLRRTGTRPFRTSYRNAAPLNGALVLHLRPPAAGTWQFRVLLGDRARPTNYVSRARTVVASGRAAVTRLRGYATAEAGLPLGRTVTDEVTALPGGSRLVLVQAQRPGTSRFVTESTLRTARSGAFRATYRPDAPGAWRYRLVLPVTATTRAVTSAPRVVRVTGAADASPAAPATPNGAAAPARSGGSGSTAPKGSGPQPSPPPTKVAPADTRTTAVLAVRTAGFPHDQPRHKLTVGTPFAFDAAASIAGPGESLTSATVDYGDGQMDTLDAADGPIDYWNTLHTYSSTGARTATLTVTDSAGKTNTTIYDVRVYDAPTATVRVTGSTALAGQPVPLALDTSTPAGTQLTTYFLIVRGENPAGVQPANECFHITGHGSPPASKDLTFTIPGTYTVELRVESDAGGASDVTATTVQVT